MNKIKIALLGCGKVADLYLPVFKYIKEVELVALADIDQEAANELAKTYSVPKVYKTSDDLAADKDIDAVIVATPPQFHADSIEALAAAGKHILCEKPMAASTADCKRIIKACKDHGVKLQLAHMKRFMRGNQKVRAIIDSGMLGKIFMVECRWDVAVPGLIGSYREKLTTGGGLLQDHGPHMFDLIRWWTGNDIKKISATVKIVHPQRLTEDTAIVTADHENGMTSVYHTTRVFYGRKFSHDFYKIYGSKGSLAVENEHHFPTMSLESPSLTFFGPQQSARTLDVRHTWSIDEQMLQNSAFTNEVKAFSECILNDTSPRVTGEDGLHAMECVVAAYQSTLTGKKIDVPLTEEYDLIEMFKTLKARDLEELGEDYEVGMQPPEYQKINDPISAFRPPRTHEKWDDKENGMVDATDVEGAFGKIKFNN